MLSAVHLWKRWIQPVVCLPAAYQLLIIQSQQILQKTMIVPDCKEWMDACDSEMGTLERMKCWEIVDESTMPPDAELIDPKWVLKLKFENGKYVKHKGRVVAKGYLQKRTSDFSSFSPTASQVTLRVILALTAMVGFKSWDLDDTCAFIMHLYQRDRNFFCCAPRSTQKSDTLN